MGQCNFANSRDASVSTDVINISCQMQDYNWLLLLAEKGRNRTHQGRLTPLTGFEVRIYRVF